MIIRIGSTNLEIFNQIWKTWTLKNHAEKARDLDQIMWGNPCSVKFINCIGGSNSARHMATIAAVNKIWGQTAILTYILKVSFFLASFKLCACKNLFWVITLWRLLPVIAPVFFIIICNKTVLQKKISTSPASKLDISSSNNSKN